MGLFSTNYNLNNFDLLGNNWQYGSGIAGLFNGVPGMNTSVFDYSSYYSVDGSRNTGNGVLGWALGGVGVGVLGILTTALINRSQSNRSAAEAEDNQTLQNLKASLKSLGLGNEDINSLSESQIDEIMSNDPDSYKNTEFYAPVEKAKNEAEAAESAYNELSNMDSLNARLNALKPKDSKVNIAISADNIETADATIIQLVINEWNSIKQKGEPTPDSPNPEYSSALGNIAELEKLKTEVKERANDLKEAKTAKDKADKALTTAKNEAGKNIDAKKKEAKKNLEAYRASKLSSRSINNADGTALSRLFGPRNAKIGSSGSITDMNGTELSDASGLETKDWKRILAAYRQGNSETKKNIGKWVADHATDEIVASIDDNDCRQLIKVIISKYKNTGN